MNDVIFWAKTTPDGRPGISVGTHNLYVGHVALVLARRYGSLLRAFGLTSGQVAFLAFSHDTGKLQKDFASQCPVWRALYPVHCVAGARLEHPPVRHGVWTWKSLARFLSARGLCGSDGVEYWATVIGAHHGRIFHRPCPGEVPAAEKTGADGLDWEAERQALLERGWEHFGRPALPDVAENSPELWLVGGLTTLADWIGSDETQFPPDKALPPADIPLRAEQAVARLELGPPAVTPGLDFSDLFPFAPNALQTLTAEAVTGPGIYVLEAPMGTGKTEAALWVAYRLLEQGKATGLYFALPTQATSNRMYLRLEDFARRACPGALRPRLIHGSAWLEESLAHPRGHTASDVPEDAAEAEAWFASGRRALLAPLGVGTVDQALLAVVAAKHFFLRRFALAGKVVVLDEVHSYDLYTSTLVAELCRELGRLGATVLVLSATLTDRARTALTGVSPAETSAPDKAPAVRLTRVPTDGPLPSLELALPSAQSVRVSFADRSALFRRCLDAAGRGAAVLWVCNTVDGAQQTYDALRAAGECVDIGLLHSRFPLYRRQELERTWLERFGKKGDRSRGAILVSTQIVEQSVDIDADLLVTELAPSDMLLQRLGRLQRHKRDHRPCGPECLIVAEEVDLATLRTMRADAIRAALGPKARVYASGILLRTLEVWRERETVELPGDIRLIMAATYADETVPPPGWEKLINEWDGKQYALRGLALAAADVWSPAGDDRDEAWTRHVEWETLSFVLYTDETAGVRLLPNGEQANFDTPGFSLATARALARNTVRLPAYVFGPGKTPPELRPYRLHGWARVAGDGLLCGRPHGNYELTWSEERGVGLVRRPGGGAA